MFDSFLASAELLAGEFDAALLDAPAAAGAVRTLGAVKRLVDGMLGKAANRVHETAAHLATGERDAAHFVARAVGSSLGEAHRAIATADRLASLPATDAAVRAGRLSTRQAELIAKTAGVCPGTEKRLLAAAQVGDRALQDACHRALANHEDPTARATRQHAARSFRMWTADDGMVEGKFRLTPEVGGQVKAVVDADVQKVFRDRRAGAHEPHEASAADVFAERMLSAGTAKTVKTSVHVVVDHAALVRGNTTDGERCEIPGVGPVNVRLGPRTARRRVRDRRDQEGPRHPDRRASRPPRACRGAYRDDRRVAASATSTGASAAAISNSTTPKSTSPPAGPPHGGTSPGSVRNTTAENHPAGPSAPPTNTPANDHSDHPANDQPRRERGYAAHHAADGVGPESA